MFCPNAADWGNVADWASGIGSFAAVAAALWIAGGERRRADRQRLISDNVEGERRAQVLGEAVRLSLEIEAQATAYSRLTLAEGDDGRQRAEAMLNEIAGIRSQVLALQSYPISDPRIFAELGRIAHESSVDYDLANRSLSRQMSAMLQLAQSMSIRRSTVIQLVSSK